MPRELKKSENIISTIEREPVKCSGHHPSRAGRVRPGCRSRAGAVSAGAPLAAPDELPLPGSRPRVTHLSSRTGSLHVHEIITC